MKTLAMAAIAVAFMINSRLGALLLLLGAVCCFFLTKGNIYERFLTLIVYSTPYYSFSVFGDRQRFSLCILITVLLLLLLTISWLHRGARFSISTAYKLLLFLLFLVSYGLSVWFSYIPAETIIATYQLVILTYLIFIITVCKKNELKNVNTDALQTLFIQGICASVIALYVQYGADAFLGISFGEIYRYNTGRNIYNLFYNAKSILSLYLSIGMLYFFIAFINKEKIPALRWLVLFGGTFLINNSRTGLASFIVCAVLYCICNPKKIIGNIRTMTILILISVAGMYVIQYMLENRTNLSGIVDDNGRIEPIIETIKLLPKYIFFGIGGSAIDFLQSRVGIAVHNFAVAYLLQFGVLGGLTVNTLLLIPLWAYKKKEWYYLCCIIVGGMLFANWHNGLFIVPVYILALLEKGENHDFHTKVRPV